VISTVGIVRITVLEVVAFGPTVELVLEEVVVEGVVVEVEVELVVVEPDVNGMTGMVVNTPLVVDVVDAGGAVMVTGGTVDVVLELVVEEVVEELVDDDDVLDVVAPP
jgi:hypothetical protein